ncbi:MAG: signal peptidase II [Salinisphaeraceae bacterium]
MSESASGQAFRYQNAHWLWISAIVIVADQITKQLVVRSFDLYDRLVIAPFFNLVRLHNTGAAFSMFAGATPLFFVALTVVVSIGILMWLRRNPHTDRLVGASLALILGGALGNAIDRVARGHVIDFLDLHAAGYHWPAFNIADCAITVGAALLLLDMWRKRGES